MSHNNQNNFTNLVGVKWTKSSLIKTLDRMWSSYLKIILDKNEEEMTVQEKNERLDFMLQEFRPIYDSVMKYGVTVKKQDGDDKHIQTQTKKQDC